MGKFNFKKIAKDNKNADDSGTDKPIPKKAEDAGSKTGKPFGQKDDEDDNPVGSKPTKGNVQDVDTDDQVQDDEGEKKGDIPAKGDKKLKSFKTVAKGQEEGDANQDMGDVDADGNPVKAPNPEAEFEKVSTDPVPGNTTMTGEPKDDIKLDPDTGAALDKQFAKPGSENDENENENDSKDNAEKSEGDEGEESNDKDDDSEQTDKDIPDEDNPEGDNKKRADNGMADDQDVDDDSGEDDQTKHPMGDEDEQQGNEDDQGGKGADKASDHANSKSSPKGGKTDVDQGVQGVDDDEDETDSADASGDKTEHKSKHGNKVPDSKPKKKNSDGKQGKDKDDADMGGDDSDDKSGSREPVSPVSKSDDDDTEEKSVKDLGPDDKVLVASGKKKKLASFKKIAKKS